MADRYFSYEAMEEIQSGEHGSQVVFYKRTRLEDAGIRRFSEQDVRELLGLGAAAAAALLPARSWPSICRFSSGLRYERKRRKHYADYARAMAAVLRVDDDAIVEASFRSHLDVMARRRFGLALDHVAPRRNSPIDVSGSEQLRQALDRGRGAIVWASQFAFQTLAGKRALWEQGFKAIQISDPYHGFTSTRVGNLTHNPVLRRAEDRYLKGRIIFDRESGAAVTRKIVGLLDQGELILLTNNVHAGAMFLEMPIGARGHVSMPTAPLSIVARRATPFFSMAIVETEPFGRFEAAIRPISDGTSDGARSSAAKRDYARMAALALTARDHLFEHVRRAPEQYLVMGNLGRSMFGSPRGST
ncbi:hypothetical protein [Aquibium microcysteis]|uniref:hypothetical protein n=1 Tax=Aquibium microcysteis TaxID=675281 RepID=UPI00165D135A|nr:hypothetical protein [Aquibium microcysteis]